MDKTIITNPNEIILVKIDKTKAFYAYVVNVIEDIKPGWWQVKFCPLIMTSDFKLSEVVWKLDNQQIRGQEFTMNSISHQLFKVDLPKNDSNDKQLQKNDSNDKQLSDDNIPIPKPKNKSDDNIPIPRLRNKIKREIPSYLRLIK